MTTAFAINTETLADVLPAAEMGMKQRMKALADHCQKFKGADTARSIAQLATTSGLLLLALYGMFYSVYSQMYWLYALLLVPTAGLLIRLFIIQHDCGHGSFFSSRRANDMTGQVLSLLTITPYSMWKRSHNMHHANSGNLDKRGAGSVDTLTVKEYLALPENHRFLYRLYRNPLVLFFIGPPIYIFILQRFTPIQNAAYMPYYKMLTAKQAIASVMMLNISMALFYGTLMAFLGWKAVLLVFVPSIMIAFWVGQWLFFVQHQFEDTYWQAGKEWTFAEAAFHGSSYYKLPRVLQWFTGNIGYHHIHHLCSSIPNYRLQECCESNQELATSSIITLRDSFKCVRLTLWDEERSKMVGFRDVKEA